MNMHFWTQHFENYAWRDDNTLGTGPDAIWKAKGGSDLIITEIPEGSRAMFNTIAAMAAMVNSASDSFVEMLHSWNAVPDGFETEFERMQRSDEGFVRWPAKRMTYAELRSWKPEAC